MTFHERQPAVLSRDTCPMTWMLMSPPAVPHGVPVIRLFQVACASFQEDVTWTAYPVKVAPTPAL